MDMEDTEEAIARLSLPARFALAARVAERALQEMTDAGGDVSDLDAYQKGVELLWRQAIDQDVDFPSEGNPVYKEIEKPLPSDQDDPWPKGSVLGLSRVFVLSLWAIHEPDRSANLIDQSWGAIWDVMCAFHDDDEHDRIIDLETEWLHQALQLLRGHGDQPMNRHMFDSIPEYDRSTRIAEREDDDE